MKKLAALLLVAPLAACGSAEPAPEPTPTAAVSPSPEPEPSLPAPDQPTFTAVFAEACPNAAPVSEAFCKSEGFGKTGFICEFRLGEGKRQQTTTLMPGEGEWTLVDPAKTCVADAS